MSEFTTRDGTDINTVRKPIPIQGSDVAAESRCSPCGL
jgi:hypothetical protein